MKTEIEFDAGKDLITFILRGENASEIALLSILRVKQPKIEWTEHRSYPCTQFSIALKETPVKVLATLHDGVLYGPVIEGVKKVDDV